jgi:hypothetical protein
MGELSDCIAYSTGSIIQHSKKLARVEQKQMIFVREIESEEEKQLIVMAHVAMSPENTHVL